MFDRSYPDHLGRVLLIVLMESNAISIAPQSNLRKLLEVKSGSGRKMQIKLFAVYLVDKMCLTHV